MCCKLRFTVVYNGLDFCVSQFTIFNEYTVVVHKNEKIKFLVLPRQLTIATLALVLIQVSPFAGLLLFMICLN